MYTEFYGLREMPFSLTPSPRFLYLGEAHKEALALLTYGVVERKGFIVLTGEAGTGKTTMVYALLSTLNKSVHSIHLANPLVSPEEFTDYLAFLAFQRKAHFKSKAGFLVEFEEFLRQCLRVQKTVILIIDEAQSLSFELLEEIRLLSNMESAEEKLINIFLVGQPELTEKLRDRRCLALVQRIAHRYHIPPLDRKDTEGYVTTRLRRAGAHDPYAIFPKGTIEAVYRYSGGYPRLINVLGDNALLLGYSKGKRKITSGLVEQCFEDMSLEGSVIERKQRPPQPYAIKKWKSHALIRYWKWAAVLCCLAALLAVGVSHKGRNLLGQLFRSEPASHGIPSEVAPPEQVTVKVKKTRKRESPVTEPHLEDGLPSGVPREDKGAHRSVIDRAKAREPSSPLTVELGVICRGVAYRRPLAIGDSFPASVGELYCFTNIVGARSPTQITHVWYFGDTEMARVNLKVKASTWRTYSSKAIKAHEVGQWRVAVLGPGGKALKTLEFKITR